MKPEEIIPYLACKPKARLSDKGKFNLDSEYPNENANKIGIINSFGLYDDEISGILKISDNYSFDFCEIDEVEIFLHPLSDLVKERTIDGKTFVPIVRLFNAENQDFEFRYDTKGLLILKRTILYGKHQDFKNEEEIGYLSHNYKNMFYYQFEKLISWHFDVFGLIEKGEAIDINTIKI